MRWRAHHLEADARPNRVPPAQGAGLKFTDSSPGLVVLEDPLATAVGPGDQEPHLVMTTERRPGPFDHR